MKIFRILAVLFILAGIYSCDNEKIEVSPEISFKQESISVKENEEYLKVPLEINVPLTENAFVYVEIDEESLTGGLNKIFATAPVYVYLEKDAIRGNVLLRIIDNKFPNENATFNLKITKVTGGASPSKTKQICKVTIEDDDNKKDVNIGFKELKVNVGENQGYVEVPVVVDSLLSGFLTFNVEAIDGTATSKGDNWDYKIETPQVKIKQGESWGVVRLLINDSKAKKEDRNFKLKISGVSGVDENDNTVGINEALKECEVNIEKVMRQLKFRDSLIVVNETMKPFEFSVELTAPLDKDVEFTISPKVGQTAISGVNYVMKPNRLIIKKGEINASTEISIIDDKIGNKDRVCEFELTNVTEGVDIQQGTKSIMLIENDDTSVGFGKIRAWGEKGDLVKIPIILKGLNDKRAVMDLSAELREVEGNNSDYFILLSKKITILKGDTIAYAEVQLMRPEIPAYYINLKIDKLVSDGLTSNILLEEDAATCKVYGLTLPKMVATASSKLDKNYGNEGGPDFLIDGSLDTYWHSQWGPNAPLPHWVKVDMGMDYSVSAIEMWRRMTAGNNDMKKCTLQISKDGETWEDIETYTYSKADDKYREKTFDTPVTIRYVKYYITESHRAPFAGIAEIKIHKEPFLP